MSRCKGKGWVKGNGVNLQTLDQNVWISLAWVAHLCLASSQNMYHFIKVQTAFEWSDAHGTVYLDLDLSKAFRSLLSKSSFLPSRDLPSCRFTSPSSSDLISELTDEVLWPCRPPERAGDQRQENTRLKHLKLFHHRVSEDRSTTVCLIIQMSC